jgi:hypothetical protein
MGKKRQPEKKNGSRPKHLTDFEARVTRYERSQELVREYGTVLVWHRWIDENLTLGLRNRFHPPESAKDALRPTWSLIKRKPQKRSFAKSAKSSRYFYLRSHTLAA